MLAYHHIIKPLGSNFSEIWIKLPKCIQEMHLKMSSAKRWPFCLGRNMWRAQLTTALWDCMFSFCFPHPLPHPALLMLNWQQLFTGPCLTTATWRCRKNFSQWERSFLWKLRSHWLKGLRQRQIAVARPGILILSQPCKQRVKLESNNVIVIQFLLYMLDLFLSTWWSIPGLVSNISEQNNGTREKKLLSKRGLYVCHRSWLLILGSFDNIVAGFELTWMTHRAILSTEAVDCIRSY